MYASDDEEPFETANGSLIPPGAKANWRARSKASKLVLSKARSKASWPYQRQDRHDPHVAGVALLASGRREGT